MSSVTVDDVTHHVLLQAARDKDAKPPSGVAAASSSRAPRRSLLPPPSKQSRLKSPSQTNAAAAAAAAVTSQQQFQTGDRVLVSGVKPGVVRLVLWCAVNDHSILVKLQTKESCRVYSGLKSSVNAG